MIRKRWFLMLFISAVVLFLFILATTFVPKHSSNEKRRPLERSVVNELPSGLWSEQNLINIIPENQTTVATQTALLAGKRIISLGNSFWGEPAWEIGTGSGIFDRLRCPVRNCHVTDDIGDIPVGDAVLFHIHELGQKPPVFKRPLHQRWIFFMLESPVYVPNKAFASPEWRSLFNWTMTYRLDSDIPIPYGEVKRHHVSNIAVNTKDYISIAKSKSKMVAWFVSNCDTGSEREKYVDVLRKYIPVDIYGRCGNKTCLKTMADADAGCGAMINKTYLFYLAFENNFCQDYITEKFYKVLRQDVVPIVRGGYEKGDYLKVVPQNWIIDTEDFESPNQLAKYLRFLRDNPKIYADYFKNKERYHYVPYYGLSQIPFWCNLCEKLNDPKETTKVIKDMSTWWGPKNCRYAKDLNSKLFFHKSFPRWTRKIS